MKISCFQMFPAFVLSILLPIKSFAGPEFLSANSGELTGSITLRQVIPRVLMNNPDLSTFSLEVRAQEARILDAGLLPNPELEISFEDFGGSGEFDGVDQSEATIQLEQLIELGGKRVSRLRAASLSRDLANWDYEIKRMDILTHVVKAYVDVLTAQEGILLSENLVQLAEKILAAVEKKVADGKVSPIEVTKAKIELSSRRIAFEHAKRELEVTRLNLASTWGSTIPEFKSALGDLYSIAPVPGYDELTRQLAKNPDIERWAAKITQRQAALDLERSKAVPDIEISGGFKRLETTRDNAAILGFSIPLQFFNRNQGGIQEARYRLAKTESEKRAAELHANTALAQAYHVLVTTHSEAESIKSQVIPLTQSAYDATQEDYRSGKSDFLHVLDSQRTLFQARVQYLFSLANYHKAIADVERLTGEPLETLKNISEKENPFPQ